MKLVNSLGREGEATSIQQQNGLLDSKSTTSPQAMEIEEGVGGSGVLKNGHASETEGLLDVSTLY